MTQKRTAFFISDSTGITAAALGKLLEHFPDTEFQQVRLPFVNTLDKIVSAKNELATALSKDGLPPIVIMSVGDTALRQLLKEANAYFVDLFHTFIEPLGEELGVKPLTGAGIAHGNMSSDYYDRMEAVNYTLSHDDGITQRDLSEAQVILIGVSRCGKTPTSIYLAMQFGVKVSNYPLIPEDFERGVLPTLITDNLHKVFGLTIQPERLHSVRSERRPGSFYASLENCRKEIASAEKLMRQMHISVIDSTSRSIEELSAIILQKLNLHGG